MACQRGGSAQVCMTFSTEISLNSSSLVFKLSGLDWGASTAPILASLSASGGSFLCLTKVL